MNRVALEKMHIRDESQFRGSLLSLRAGMSKVGKGGQSRPFTLIELLVVVGN